MLGHIWKNTLKFLDEMPKNKRKKKGQFFTSSETAKFMAEMFNVEELHGIVNVLDPGTGTGILVCALVQRLQKHSDITEIFLTCYENDPDVLPVLRKNLDFIKNNSTKKVVYHLIEEDYLISQANDFEQTLFANVHPKKFDLVIGNPPYLRISRNSEEAMVMPKVVHGAPNLYFLFAAMSMFNLKKNAEMVYIIPRSWTSGLYFTSFRKYFLSEGKLEHIHLFVSRDKVFSEEEVLQETIIIKAKRTEKQPQYVLVTSSNSNGDFDDITELKIPYSSVVAGKDMYVYLPTCKEDVEAIGMINRYVHTLPDIGLRMKTGIVVDFRQKEELRETEGDHNFPLFYSQHIVNGIVNHEPSGKEFDWISGDKPGLLQKNKNYVFCKRFTAKEENRRLQCGIYKASDFSSYEAIGTQNKINFVDSVNGEEMDMDLTYGIFALLNSSLFDRYYRILNGSTQVNSTEINTIPVPELELIKVIGNELISCDDLSTASCDKIIAEVAYE